MELIKEFVLPDDTYGGEVQTREACRAIIFDENGMMPLMFVSAQKHHKLPGGGIEPGEDKKIALIRELHEETGCEAEMTKEIGMVIESNATRKQTSYCYLGTIVRKSENDFTDLEKERGYELQWTTLDEAIQLIKSDIPDNETGKRVQQRDICILEKAKEMI